MSLLGQRLRQEREARGLPFLQIELDTRIRANIIQSLEEGDLENLPPEPFLRGLIRSYATYLRVSPQELLDLYEADTTPAPPPPTSTRQRPTATQHTPAVRPETFEPRTLPPSADSAPRPWVRLPEQNQEPQPPVSRSGARRAPVFNEPPAKPVESAQPPNVEPPRLPASMPEPVMPPPQDPLTRLRRRLPLAPPSPKPKNPFLASGREKRPSAPPPEPPETLPPPERLERSTPKTRTPEYKPPIPKPEPKSFGKEPAQVSEAAAPELMPIARTRAGWPIRLGQVPRSSVILMSVAIVSGLLACGLFAFTHLAPMALSVATGPTATATRIQGTAVPTSLPGTSPTNIPTIAATAPPFTPVPIVVAPTARATPKSTLAATPTDLNLDIDAREPITAHIGIDGETVFNGPIAAGQSLSWSAKESLYMRVENPKGASIRFNAKAILALNFGERSLIERQWVLKNGRPASVSPAPPPTPKAGASEPVKSVAASATPTQAIQTAAPTMTLPASTPTQTKPPAPTRTLTPFS